MTDKPQEKDEKHSEVSDTEETPRPRYQPPAISSSDLFHKTVANAVVGTLPGCAPSPY